MNGSEKKTMTVQQLTGKQGEVWGIYYGDTLVLPGQYSVNKAKVHWGIHLEEAALLALLREGYGEEMFPGSMGIKLEFVDAGLDHPDALEDLKQGILQLGLGNGPFNEHETHERKAIEDECSMSLFAKLVGVYDDETITSLVDYATRTDRKKQGRFDFSEMMKVHYSFEPNEYVAEMAIRLMQSQIKSQQDFHGASKAEIDVKLKNGDAGEMNVRQIGGRMLRLLWIKSEERAVAAYARAKTGRNVKIVVQERQGGKFYIPIQKDVRLDDREVIRMLRLAELRKQGKTLAGFKPGVYDRLTDEVCEEVPEWRSDRAKTGSIFGGGSLSNKEAPVSRLTMEEVLQAVRRGLIRRFDAPKTEHVNGGDFRNGPRLERERKLNAPPASPSEQDKLQKELEQLAASTGGKRTGTVTPSPTLAKS